MAFSCVCLISLGLLAGCKKEAVAEPPLTRVNAVKAKLVDYAPEVTFTGLISARIETVLSFRVNGKIVERFVNPGEHVTVNQILARLDPVEQEAELDSAKAGVRSAEAQLRQATASFERQKNLLATGNTTRRDYDQAEAAQRSAQAQIDQAHSQLTSAQDQLSYTELRADADGIITARSAEAGQVVAQAQAVYTLARDGPRDAVFNVHEWALANVDMAKGFTIAMVSDPSVTTMGDVREISPVVNPNTMTTAVKVRLRETPYAMILGSVITGVAPIKPRKVFLLPWSSLYERNGKPAVWVIDPGSSIVKLVEVVVDRYDRSGVSVLSGLENGQVVVTEGVQMLYPGQKVEIAAEAKP